MIRKGMLWLASGLLFAMLLSACTAGEEENGNTEAGGEETRPANQEPAPGNEPGERSFSAMPDGLDPDTPVSSDGQVGPPPQGDSDAAGGGETGSSGGGSESNNPETKEVTVSIEGTEEPMTVKRFSSPGFPFSTYHPEDMIAETVSSGEGDGVRFVANFGGQRNDEAYLSVFLHPEDASEEDARAMLETVATGFGQEVAELSDHRYEWSLAEYAGMASGKSVFIALGQHEDRFFSILTHYPAEYGDGFAPRTVVILDEWRWSDTNNGL